MSRSSAADVRALIEAAWRDAIYPGDDRISGPTYDDEGVAAYFRGKTWQGHEVVTLRYHSVGLSFFTPEAFDYYLAAYMLAVVEDIDAADVIYDGILFSLSPLQLGKQWADKYRAQIAGLSDAQRRAIAAYLGWCEEPDGRGGAGIAETIAYLATGHVPAAGSSANRLLQLAGATDESPATIAALWLSYTTVGDAELAGLAELPALRELRLSDTAVSDAGLANLAATPGLEILDLSGCEQLSASGLAHVGRLTRLAELELANVDVDDAGLEALAPLQLRKLGLVHARRLTEAGWHALDATRLDVLTMFGVDAPFALLDKLGRAGRIQRLEVASLDDDGLVALAAAATLAELDVSRADRVTTRGLAALAALPALRSLQLGQLAATAWPTGFRSLAALTLLDVDLRSDGLGQLPVLTELRIFTARFQPGALAAIARLPQLATLTLWCATLSDAILTELAGCATLASLSARFASLDGGLAVLAQLPALTTLRLEAIPAFDAAAAQAIASAPRLRELALDDVAITDDDLASLGACPSLRSFRLARTQVTPAGLAAFRAAHPDVTVIET